MVKQGPMMFDNIKDMDLAVDAERGLSGKEMLWK